MLRLSKERRAMKLSKKGAAVQQAIHDALASGKALGGLLVGFAATVAGCREGYTPAHTMGRFPDSRYQENTKNEDTEELVTAGVILLPEDNDVKPEQADAVPPPVFMDKLPDGCYRVQIGDTLTQIAKAHGTSVAELKRLNGFDDYRADRIWDGEVIKVPQSKTNAVREVQGKDFLLRGEPLAPPSQSNAVNEDRSKALSVKGRFPSKK